MFYQPSQGHGLPHDPFKACVAPRPIAWVSSLDAQGRANLAPFSYFNAVASEPPMVMVSFSGYHREGGAKDTLANIRATGEFVVNVVPLALKDAMNATSGDHPHDIDEIAFAGLETAPSELVTPPRVALAPIHLECRLHREIELPCTRENSMNAMVLAEVIGVHIDDAILVDGLIDLERVKPLSRLGYMQYSAVDHLFSMRRPTV